MISIQHHMQFPAKEIRKDRKKKRQPNWKELKLYLIPSDMVLYKENPKEPTKLY